jgi:hypothetical protein
MMANNMKGSSLDCGMRSMRVYILVKTGPGQRLWWFPHTTLQTRASLTADSIDGRLGVRVNLST